MAKSLHELKEEKTKKDSNIITDSDYFLRDKEEERKNGKALKNTIDMTPEPKKSVKKAPATKETTEAN